MKLTKYYVKWKSKLTEKTGQGNPIADKQEATDWAKYANNKFPEIIHWVESIEVEVPDR